MKLKSTLVAAAAFFGACASANAAVIPVLTGVTDNGSNFTFTYEGTLSGDAGLMAGSKLVIFDFLGYVDGSVYSPYADVAASVELVTNGLLTVPGAVDDPGVQNLVFTWTNGPFNASGGPYAPVNFSGLSADSIYGGLGADIFAALTVKNNPDNVPGGSGTLIYDTGSVTVPGMSAVPEPATWAMMIIGFGAVGGAVRSKRRKQQAVFA